MSQERQQGGELKLLLTSYKSTTKKVRIQIMEHMMKIDIQENAFIQIKKNEQFRCKYYIFNGNCNLV